MKKERFAKHAFIVLWVLWVMLIVRFGFRIGLIGFGGKFGTLSTILFTSIFCVLIPVSLLAARVSRIRRLIWAGISLCSAGIAALVVLGAEYIYIVSILLSAGSALLTSSFLFIYVYGLSRREQIVWIVVFLLTKPLSSLAALMISMFTMMFPCIVLALTVIVAIGFCGRSIRITDNPADNHRRTAIQTPIWTFAGLYALYALIVFERMNCAFTLFAKGLDSSVPYYVYFAGGIIMAIAAYLLFVYKKVPVSVALNIFLFLSIIYFIISVAIESGLIAFSSISMAFLGFSDIIYVFLFVTGASISNMYPDKKVFMGFVFVFGFALICAFAFSHYLFIKYQDLYTIIYSLTSLAMIAVCILMIPLMHKIETNMISGKAISESVHLKKPQPFILKQDRDLQPITQLTQRENEIVSLYLKGYSNQQVAETLYIAPATLKVHCRNIYNKLNIKSRLELHFLFQDHAANEEK